MLKCECKGKLFWTVILALWIIFSVGYVCYTEWQKFKIGVMTNSYQTGRIEIVNQILTEAEKCQPFPIYSGDKKAELVSVECLQKQMEAAQNQAAGAEKPAGQVEAPKGE